jgi:hypothetical protein
MTIGLKAFYSYRLMLWHFLLIHPDGEVEHLRFHFSKLILGGWTGRNREDVLLHIEELKKIGVPEPERVPVFFPVGANLLYSGNSIQVFSDKTSGEVEYVLLIEKDEPKYVTVGSDHTDREIERVSVHLSKLLYPKIVAPVVWSYDDVRNHWDELILTMEIDNILVQESRTSAILHPEKLIELCGEKERAMIFSGSIKWRNGFLRFGKRYRISLRDPVLRRSISFSYETIRI